MDGVGMGMGTGHGFGFGFGFGLSLANCNATRVRICDKNEHNNIFHPNLTKSNGKRYFDEILQRSGI